MKCINNNVMHFDKLLVELSRLFMLQHGLNDDTVITVILKI